MMDSYAREYRLPGAELEQLWEDMWKRGVIRARLPQDFNRKLEKSRKQKQPEVMICFDRAVRHGQDAEALEPEDIRQGGVSLSTLQDFQTAFQNINLDEIRLCGYCGAENAALLGAFSALRKANGEGTLQMQGVLGADPLGALAEEGVLPIGLEALYDEMAQAVLWADQHMPQIDTVLVRSAPYQDGGASLAQEMACTMAVVREYLEELLKRGVTLDTAARHLKIALAASGNKTMDEWKAESIALLWQEMMRSYFQRETMLEARIYFIRAGYNHAAYDPYFSLDGLYEECTCWYRKALMQEFIGKVREIMRSVEQVGGMSEALAKGALQDAIQSSLAYRLTKIPCRMQAERGICVYVHTKEREIAVQPVDTELFREQRLGAITDFREDADEYQRTLALARVTLTLTKPGLGLIQMLQEAFLSGATLGDTVIALHAGQDDFYIEKVIEKHDLVEYLKMRSLRMRR